MELRIPGSDGFCLGVDVGSTTVKLALLNDGALVYQCYERHMTQVRETLLKELGKIDGLVGGSPLRVYVSGSAGMGLANGSGLPFIQEVFATTELVRTLEKDVSAVIELGGEDAKIIFFDGGVDERMNGTCAGGTGAFIDQMSSLLDISNEELDERSLRSGRVYPIASRCGVFAKTDVQALLNQGADRDAICASIYQSIVNQTISGLAQGRRIKGKVLFLGGPLTFCRGLRKRFVDTLNLREDEAVLPEYSRISVALGAAIHAGGQKETRTLADVIRDLEEMRLQIRTDSVLEPLFEDPRELEEFRRRHSGTGVARTPLSEYSGRAFLGIDCGSTTTKLALIGEDCSLLYSHYTENRGDPVEVIREQISRIYGQCNGPVRIASSCVTGYGEDLARAAFGIDHGLVETLAHYRSARFFDPDVDYILDIGGQDIKCFRIENGTVSSICLNEACSSGCGSFLQTFARSMGYTVQEFAELGLTSRHPSNLGSRCTVFMNSSVKQALKDGAEPADISAGLSVSVVRNALFKVIREPNTEALGKNIVVQGGTFLNDCVLRAFEKEVGRDVTRPDIAGLMGAFGCALYARDHVPDEPGLISPRDLESFSHRTIYEKCQGCGNACNLCISEFSNGGRFVSGNNCEKGLRGTVKTKVDDLPNLFEFKRGLLREVMRPVHRDGAPVVGIPLTLSMYEMAPFWKAVFSELGFSVVFSGFTDKRMISEGQYTVPSDTVCFPAKVMHGHVLRLLSVKPDVIFYPSLTYNLDEGSFKFFNCPVVAYYGEVLHSNMDDLSSVDFQFPYLNINSDRELAKELYRALGRYGMSSGDFRRAVKAGRRAYLGYKEKVFQAGEAAFREAEKRNLPVLVVVGRPYQVDNEVCHGIDRIANETGFAVVTGDSLRPRKLPELQIMNQWTFHSRMYNACTYVNEHENAQLLQLVSFGCGIDAITTDEVRRLLEENGKMYTQIKIDEQTNPVAMRVRLRSLKGVLDEREVHRGRRRPLRLQR